MLPRLSFAALLALTFVHCASWSASKELPDGWIVRPPAAEDAPERYCFNRSEELWLVSTSGDELSFRPWQRSHSGDALDWSAIPRFLRSGAAGYAPGITGVLSILKVDVGYLVGQDGGEWGGWLRWYSDDGTQVRLILQQNTSAIVRVGGRVIAVTRGQDGWHSTGALRNLSTDESERWTVGETWPLNGWARAVSVTQQNELVIATSNGVTTFHNGKVQVLPAQWDLLNPSSVVKTSDGIYVGMQSLVVELRSTRHGVVERWLVPRSCARFVGDESPDYIVGGWENCRCASK